MPGVLKPSASLTGGRKLNIFLGGRAMSLLLCLVNILLSRTYVVRGYGMYAVEMGLALNFAVRVAGFMARRIC